MARFAARKAELAAITEIITSDTYESEADMAKAVLSTAFELIRNRPELWSVAHYIGDSTKPTFFGIEGTEKAARDFAATLGGGRALLVPIHSAGAFEENRRSDEAAWELRQTSVCANCGHEKWAHEKHSFNGKPTPSVEVKAPCSNKCQCEKYVPPHVAWG